MASDRRASESLRRAQSRLSMPCPCRQRIDSAPALPAKPRGTVRSDVIGGETRPALQARRSDQWYPMGNLHAGKWLMSRARASRYAHIQMTIDVHDSRGNRFPSFGPGSRGYEQVPQACRTLRPRLRSRQKRLPAIDSGRGGMDPAAKRPENGAGSSQGILFRPCLVCCAAHKREGGDTDNLIRSWNASTAAALATLVGTQAKGAWKLEVTDHEPPDTGKLNRWRLALTAA